MFIYLVDATVASSPAYLVGGETSSTVASSPAYLVRGETSSTVQQILDLITYKATATGLASIGHSATPSSFP